MVGSIVVRQPKAKAFVFVSQVGLPDMSLTRIDLLVPAFLILYVPFSYALTVTLQLKLRKSVEEFSL